MDTNFKKVDTKDITDAIAFAMEQADKMKYCVIVYQLEDDDTHTHGIVGPNNQNLAQTNYLLDVAKAWCLGLVQRP